MARLDLEIIINSEKQENRRNKIILFKKRFLCYNQRCSEDCLNALCVIKVKVPSLSVIRLAIQFDLPTRNPIVIDI